MRVRIVIAAALDAWGAAQRLLDELPPSSPDRILVELVADSCLDAYQELAAREVSPDTIATGWAVAVEALKTLERIRGRAAVGAAPVVVASGSSQLLLN